MIFRRSVADKPIHDALRQLASKIDSVKSGVLPLAYMHSADVQIDEARRTGMTKALSDYLKALEEVIRSFPHTERPVNQIRVASCVKYSSTTLRGPKFRVQVLLVQCLIVIA